MKIKISEQPKKKIIQTNLFSLDVKDDFEERNKKSEELKSLGEMYAEQKNYQMAITTWQNAINMTPEKAVLFELQAQVFMEMDEYFKAIKMAEEVVRLEPQWVIGYLTLGRAQINFGEPELGLESLNKAKELDIKNEYPEIDEELNWVTSIIYQTNQKNNEQTNNE